MKTVHVLPNLRALVAVAASAGGSADVRYGLEEPQTRYVADLALRPGDMVWLFACLPGDVWIAARVPWTDNLWLVLAANGIQPADCPVDVWVGSAGLAREVNVSADPLGGLEAVERGRKRFSIETKQFHFER